MTGQVEKKPSLREAHEAACECAREAWEVFETAELVSVHTSDGSAPTKTMIRRMAACMQRLKKAIEGGREHIEPWRLELAKACGDVVWGCTTQASSMHLLALRAVEELLTLNWTTARIRAYYRALWDKKAGRLDWNRKIEPDVKVEAGSLINCRFGGSAIEAELESEYAQVPGSGRLVRKPLTSVEQRVCDVLQETDKDGLTGDEIAVAVRVEPGGGGIRGTLARLREDGIIDNAPRRGYFIADARS